MSVRSKLIQTGVMNLKEFGYPNVDEKNILKDPIYKEFFKSMIEETLSKGVSDSNVEAVLESLSEELK